MNKSYKYIRFHPDNLLFSRYQLGFMSLDTFSFSSFKIITNHLDNASDYFILNLGLLHDFGFTN